MSSKERVEHILNAPFLSFDIDRHLKQLRTEQQWRVGDRNAITLVKNHELCIVLISLHQGARMEQHEISGPLTLQVIEGSLRFLVHDETYDLGPHSLLSLDKEIVHDVVALEDCSFLLTIIYPKDEAASQSSFSI